MKRLPYAYAHNAMTIQGVNTRGSKRSRLCTARRRNEMACLSVTVSLMAKTINYESIANAEEQKNMACNETADDNQPPNAGPPAMPSVLAVPNNPIASPLLSAGIISDRYAACPVGVKPVENP